MQRWGTIVSGEEKNRARCKGQSVLGLFKQRGDVVGSGKRHGLRKQIWLGPSTVSLAVEESGFLWSGMNTYQGYQTHFHWGPHQPRGCLQRAKIILGLCKCNYSLTVEELK